MLQLGTIKQPSGSREFHPSGISTTIPIAMADWLPLRAVAGQVYHYTNRWVMANCFYKQHIIPLRIICKTEVVIALLYIGSWRTSFTGSSSIKRIW